MKNVCVYCASSSKTDSIYQEAATELGYLLAQNQLTCICGAGFQGLMKTLSDAVMEKNGRVIGVIPRFMYEEGWGNDSLSKLIITETIHERKNQMAALSDAVIALPGGCGTMEELLEIITWKQLGLYSKPIIILNINNYYNDLLSMLEKAAAENFIHSKHKGIWHVAQTPEGAMDIISQQPQWENNPRSFAAL